MRILYLHKFNLNSGWGGSASMLKSLCDAFIGLGHRVEVVSRVKPDPFGFTTCQLPFQETLTFGPDKREGETCIEEIDVAKLRGMAVSTADTIGAQLFTQGVPDLIIVNHINLMALAALHLAVRYSVPYRVLSMGTDTKLLIKHAQYRELFGPAARAADRVFAISSFVAREVIETVGGNVETLGGAIDPDVFYPSNDVNVGCGIVYIGRLVGEKGLATLLRAYRMLDATVDLKIVGEGPLREELQADILFSGLNSAQLVGLKSAGELREIMSHSTCAVVPSTWDEPLGLVVLESLACGLPVIASSVGGIPEILKHGKNGLLVPPGDSRALANAINRLLVDEALRSTLRNGALATEIPSYMDLARRIIAPT